MANAHTEKLQAWFASLQPRERILVIIAGVVTTISLLYFIIWAPLNASLDENTRALSQEQELVTWLAEQSLRAQRLRQVGTQSSASGSLTQIVNQTTRANNIAISRMQPQGEQLQILIDAVPFNDLVKWLDVLEKRGVIVLQSDISDTNDSGIVQVRRLQLGKA